MPGSMRTCGACRRSLSNGAFSRSQLKKWKLKARCKKCILGASTKSIIISPNQVYQTNLKVNKAARQLTGYSSESENESLQIDNRISRKRKSSSISPNINTKRLKNNDVFQIPANQVKRIPQLGDGNCLYRSLVFGLHDKRISHINLRRLLADWILENKKRKINGSDIQSWIKWEKHCDVIRYCEIQRSNSNSWGGQVELCAFSHMFKYQVNVFQYQRKLNCYERITVFPSSSNHNNKVINLLYVNKNHYDALVIR